MAADASSLIHSFVGRHLTRMREGASASTVVRTIGMIVVAVVSGFVADVTVSSASADDPFAYHELAMYRRPEVAMPKTVDQFADGLAELWIRCLEREDAELRRLVVDTIAHAYRRGVPGLDQAKAPLVALAQDPDQRLDVVRALVHALIVMDARDQDELLSELAQRHGAPVAEIVEPALAKWKSDAHRDVWLGRIQSRTASPAMMSMAIEGVASLGDQDAIEPLTELVRSVGESTHLRMIAARGLATIDRENLVPLAKEVNQQRGPHPGMSALLAIELMVQHDSQEAIEFLDQFVTHDNTAVQSRALQRLYEIDFQLVDRHSQTLMSSKDVNVRRWCAVAMVDRKDAERIGPLATMLDDVNPTLRRSIADALVGLAGQDELRDEVIKRTEEVLNQNAWRGCEQACVVLGKLDYEPSGPRMVELLGHERGEVQVAAAWGLTQLRVEALLPDMLDHAQSIYDAFSSNQLTDTVPGASLHVAHLFIAFGDQEYRPAEPLLRKYIPKDFSLGTESRAAACWAIGMLYQDNPDANLVKQLTARLNDTGFEGETEETRSMSAVSLGRMKAKSALPSLRRHAGNDGSGRRCYWAIEQITGEPSPPPEDAPRLIDEWFLAPVGDDS